MPPPSLKECAQRLEKLEQWRRTVEQTLADYDRRLIEVERKLR